MMESPIKRTCTVGVLTPDAPLRTGDATADAARDPASNAKTIAMIAAVTRGDLGGIGHFQERIKLTLVFRTIAELS